MQSASRIVAVFLLVSAAGADGAVAFASSRATDVSQVSPVQKVIQMLNGMLVKGKEEKNSEQVQFAAFKQFCDDTVQEKTRDVERAREAIDMLQAKIQLAQTAGEDLMREVTKHDNDVATWEADSRAAAKIRKKEAQDYSVGHKDYTETIDAVTMAIQILQAEAAKGPRQQASEQGLLQLAAAGSFRLVPEENKRAITAFLAKSSDEPDMTGPESEAHAYEFRSGSVVDMLNQLKDKFFQERSNLEKEELNARHAHELYMQDVRKSIANAQESRNMKTQERAKSLQRSAEMQGELVDTTSTRADDTKYLSDMTATCTKKSADFTERQNLRAEEISAIQKAIEILSSGKVLGHSENYLAALQQQGRSRKSASLLQLSSEPEVPSKMRAAAFLNDRAAALGNQALAMLALRARADPFEKVKKMIQDLIMRLTEAAGEEAQHSAWCTAEINDNGQVRSSRTTAIERLMAEIDGKRSEMAKLKAEIAELSAQLAASTQAASKQVKLRAREKIANEQTIKDAEEAQAAVGQAVAVLREFYATAGQATVLLQGMRRQDPLADDLPVTPPPIFDSPYQGLGAENGGVVAMLEVIQSDFARLQSETEAAEEVAKTEFNRQQTEAAILKTQIEKDIEHKTSSKQAANQALVDLNNDLLTSQKELEAAVVYYDKLKPSCIKGETYAERAEKRKEEIESLQEALRILNGEDIAGGML